MYDDVDEVIKEHERQVRELTDAIVFSIEHLRNRSHDPFDGISDRHTRIVRPRVTVDLRQTRERSDIFMDVSTKILTRNYAIPLGLREDSLRDFIDAVLYMSY